MSLPNFDQQESKRKSSLMEYARRMSSRPVRSSEESVQGSTRLGSSSSVLGVGSATSGAGSNFLVEPSTNLEAGSTLQRRTSHHIQRYHESNQDDSYHTIHMWHFLESYLFHEIKVSIKIFSFDVVNQTSKVLHRNDVSKSLFAIDDANAGEGQGYEGCLTSRSKRGHSQLIQFLINPVSSLQR